LCAALALANKGASVVVVERTSAGAHEGGGGLGIDVDAIKLVTRLTTSPPVCHGVDRDTTAWHLVRDWLEHSAEQVPAITLFHDALATTVTSDDSGVSVTAADGRTWWGDVIIGADGVHSTVRRFVDPEHPTAEYAGFVLWRAMVSEALVRPVAKLPSAGEPSREFYVDRYRLVTYPVPGVDGDRAVGHRRLNVVWYDPAREELLRESGLLEGGVVRGSLQSSDISGEISEELRTIALQAWPSPWAETLRIAFDQRLVFGTPVAEYVPRRLVLDRIAISGDAAHAASPMVGGGFQQGLIDAYELARSFAESDDVTAMLSSYERVRLDAARQHAMGSQQESRRLLERGARPRP
jgi:2-polyprenyl-6-methoxyphenol hydroxylase-like FAD-dependent oxidoreductase